MGAALGKPAKAGGTLASDSRRSVSQRLERGLKQAKEELISKETWTSPRQEAETGGRCPALLLPTGKRPGPNSWIFMGNIKDSRPIYDYG